MSIQSINPATEEVIDTFEPYTTAQVNQALEEAHKAFADWRETTFTERGTFLHRVASHLRQHKVELARMATLEMGKPIIESEAEVEKCAWNCDFYADNAEKFLSDEHIASSATESYVSYLPLGVILALMPWNFPYWQVFRFAAPALMAGNTVVLKHASNVSLTALKIERMIQECGLPGGTFRTVLVPGSETRSLIEDRRIAAVTLTGSDAAGIAVASASGHALKKHVLELGGSDAFIVLEDADLDGAAQMAVRARYQNTGQSCIAAKRFIVVESIAEAFEKKFVEAASKLHMGDPLDRETQVGPMARADLREALDRQVQASIHMGARVLLGGRRNIERGRFLARHIESGGVFINGMTASDPRLPFGGVKHSGYGRELSSFGIREFVNIQTVWIGPVVSAAPTRTPSE
jgi:succinate-semialdehyde dehydrogenase/glutarate-semialdehyde dehydrogenase